MNVTNGVYTIKVKDGKRKGEIVAVCEAPPDADKVNPRDVLRLWVGRQGLTEAAADQFDIGWGGITPWAELKKTFDPIIPKQRPHAVFDCAFGRFSLDQTQVIKLQTFGMVKQIGYSEQTDDMLLSPQDGVTEDALRQMLFDIGAADASVLPVAQVAAMKAALKAVIDTLKAVIDTNPDRMVRDVQQPQKRLDALNAAQRLLD